MPANAKATLRAQQKDLLTTLAPQRATWAAAVVRDNVLAYLQPYSVIALYNALPDEFDPMPLGRELHKRGHAIALPRVAQKGAPLVFCAWQPGDTLGPDALGIASPRANAPFLVPDLILAPLLAFDDRGNRLGRGAGYYDRTLNAMHDRGQHPAFAGLGYDQQRAGHVPVTPLDVPLDFVITPSGILPCRVIDKQA